MFYRECEECGCSLDPGEGRVCDECAEKIKLAQSNRKKLEFMIKTTNYVQMEMEEFLSGNNVY